MGDKDVRYPCSEVVDGGNETFLSSSGFVEGFDEAGVGVDGGDGSDVVAVGVFC
jgi:hypothetical protein